MVEERARNVQSICRVQTNSYRVDLRSAEGRQRCGQGRVGRLIDLAVSVGIAALPIGVQHKGAASFEHDKGCEVVEIDDGLILWIGQPLRLLGNDQEEDDSHGYRANDGNHAGPRPRFSRTITRIVVLTDMLELGDQSRALHEGLAQPIEAAGLDLVHAAGPEMRRLYDALPASRRGLWRETAAELAAEASMLAAAGDIVMVKGSNGSKASLVAKALAELQTASSSPDAPRATR